MTEYECPSPLPAQFTAVNTQLSPMSGAVQGRNGGVSPTDIPLDDILKLKELSNMRSKTSQLKIRQTASFTKADDRKKRYKNLEN